MIQPSNTFSVDTLSLLDAGKAFREGTMNMSPVRPEDIPAAPMIWGDPLLNRILVSVAVLLAIIFLMRLAHLFPYLIDGMSRWKPIVTLEGNVGLARDRNSVGAIAVFAACLMASRLDVYSPAFAEGFDPGQKTLLIMGVVLGCLFLRHILLNILTPGSRSRESYRIANRCLFNFVIVDVMLVALTWAIFSLFGIKELTLRTVCIYETVLVYAVFLLRKTQIMTETCRHFTAFLYLCALELLPAGILVSSAVLL